MVVVRPSSGWWPWCLISLENTSWLARGLYFSEDDLRSISLTLLSIHICIQWQDKVETTGDSQDAGAAGIGVRLSTRPPKGLHSSICVRFTPLAFRINGCSRKAAEVWYRSFPSPAVVVLLIQCIHSWPTYCGPTLQQLTYFHYCCWIYYNTIVFTTADFAAWWYTL